MKRSLIRHYIGNRDELVEGLTPETDARNLGIGPRSGLVEPFDGTAELCVDSIAALKRDWSTHNANSTWGSYLKDEQNFID